MSTASIKTYLMNLEKSKSDAYYILSFIKSNPKCNKNDIIFHLGLTHQTTTARLSDLLNYGVISIAGQKQYKDSVLSLFIAETDHKKIQINIDKREEQAFKKWVKKGHKKFKHLLSNDLLSEIEILL